MEGIVDIHNHILYGLDDGARTLQESMAIIEESYSQGVRTIIFTPHYSPGAYDKEPHMIRCVYEKIRNEAGNRYPDMEFYLGNEILCTGEVIELLNEEKIYTMADSKYVLVEFFIEIEYEQLEHRVKEILMNGYIPIVAHCERYECLREDISNVVHLVESGAYIQVNAKSVFSFGTRKFVKKLIEEDCVHFIASDAHDTDKRKVVLDKCIAYLSKRYNEEYVKELFVDNPQKIIKNQYV